MFQLWLVTGLAQYKRSLFKLRGNPPQRKIIIPLDA